MSLRDIKLFIFTEYNSQALCMLNWKEKDFWKKESYIALWYIETEFSIKSGNFWVFVRGLHVSAIPKLTSYWNNSVSILWFAASKVTTLLKK